MSCQHHTLTLHHVLNVSCSCNTQTNAGAPPAVTCCPLAVDMKNCVQVSEMYNLVKKNS